MKKIIKKLVFLIITISCILAIYFYKDKLIVIVNNIKDQVEQIYLNNVKKEEDTDAKIREFIENSDANISKSELGKLDNYYYKQLNSSSKIIYNAFKDNIEVIKTGKYNIRLSSILEEVLKNKNGQEKLEKDFQDAWDAFKLDNPQIYYINVSKMCLVTKTITKGLKVNFEIYLQNEGEETSLLNQFASKEEVDNTIQQINDVKNEIMKKMPNGDLLRVLYVHNWIVDNIKYDTTTIKENNSNIYGGLVQKEVICEGYAKTFKYLLDEMEIPCVLVCGTGIDENGKEERHAWNYVYVNNTWYAIDTTWDDPIIIGDGKLNNNIKYRYFLNGSDEFFKNHIENGKFTNNGMEFKYPQINKTNLFNIK